MQPYSQVLFCVGAAAAVPTTYNASDKSANISLSNGNLTATATSSSDGGVRSTASKSAGLLFLQWVIGANFSGGNCGVGITKGSSNLATIGTNGADGFYIFKSGNIYYNGSATGSNGGAFGTGDIVSLRSEEHTSELQSRRDLV